MRRLALSLLLAACQREGSTAPKRPSVAAVREAAAKVVLCKSTEEEFRRALGAPYRDGRIAAGRVASWSPAGAESPHYLAVLLRDGLVVDIYFDVPTEVAWSPADRCPR